MKSDLTSHDSPQQRDKKRRRINLYTKYFHHHLKSVYTSDPAQSKIDRKFVVIHIIGWHILIKRSARGYKIEHFFESFFQHKCSWGLDSIWGVKRGLRGKKDKQWFSAWLKTWSLFATFHYVGKINFLFPNDYIILICRDVGILTF